MISPVIAAIRLQVTIFGVSLRKKLATLVTKTKSTDSKRRTRSTRPTRTAGAPVFATVHSDVGVKLPPPLPKTMGRKNTP